LDKAAIKKYGKPGNKEDGLLWQSRYWFSKADGTATRYRLDHGASRTWGHAGARCHRFRLKIGRNTHFVPFRRKAKCGSDFEQFMISARAPDKKYVSIVQFKLMYLPLMEREMDKVLKPVLEKERRERNKRRQRDHERRRENTPDL
jgi:hypothetical protein